MRNVRRNIDTVVISVIFSALNNTERWRHTHTHTKSTKNAPHLYNLHTFHRRCAVLLPPMLIEFFRFDRHLDWWFVSMCVCKWCVVNAMQNETNEEKKMLCLQGNTFKKSKFFFSSNWFLYFRLIGTEYTYNIKIYIGQFGNDFKLNLECIFARVIEKMKVLAYFTTTLL